MLKQSSSPALIFVRKRLVLFFHNQQRQKGIYLLPLFFLFHKDLLLHRRKHIPINADQGGKLFFASFFKCSEEKTNPGDLFAVSLPKEITGDNNLFYFRTLMLQISGFRADKN